MFPGFCNVKLVISRDGLAGWLLAVLNSVENVLCAVVEGYISHNLIVFPSHLSSFS